MAIQVASTSAKNVAQFVTNINALIGPLLSNTIQSIQFNPGVTLSKLGDDLQFSITYATTGSVITNPYFVNAFAGNTLTSAITAAQAFITANPTYFISPIYSLINNPGSSRTASNLVFLIYNTSSTDGAANWAAGGSGSSISGTIAAGQVAVGTGANAIGGSANLTFNALTGLVENTTTTSNVFELTGSIASFAETNIQNTMANAAASTDVVATADNGTSTTHYIDLGINSSLGGGVPFTGANATYLYTTENEFNIGPQGAAALMNIQLGPTPNLVAQFTGPTIASNAFAVKYTTSATSSTVGGFTVGNGVAGTSVAVGAGNINAGGTLTTGGQVAIGGSAPAAGELSVTGSSILTGTTQTAILINNWASTSAATNATRGLQVSIQTSAAAYVCPSVVGVLVGSHVKGAGSTITSSYGYTTNQQTQGSTSNVGFLMGSVGSEAAGNWGFYDAGTLNNAFNVGGTGGTLFGTSSTAGLVAGGVSIGGTTAATSSTVGTLLIGNQVAATSVAVGAGKINAGDTTAATSISTGSVQTSGGYAASRSSFFRGIASSSDANAVLVNYFSNQSADPGAYRTALALTNNNGGASAGNTSVTAGITASVGNNVAGITFVDARAVEANLDTGNATATTTAGYGFYFKNGTNTGTTTTKTAFFSEALSGSTVYLLRSLGAGLVAIADTTEASAVGTASVITSGGLGVAKRSFLGTIGGTFAGNVEAGVQTGAADVAGQVGETQEVTASSVAVAGTGTVGNVCTFTLQPGKWVITGSYTINQGATGLTTGTAVNCSIVTSTATNGTQGTTMAQDSALLAATGLKFMSAPTQVVNISAATSYFLTEQCTFGGGAPTVSGKMTAVRVR